LEGVGRGGEELWLAAGAEAVGVGEWVRLGEKLDAGVESARGVGFPTAGVGGEAGVAEPAEGVRTAVDGEADVEAEREDQAALKHAAAVVAGPDDEGDERQSAGQGPPDRRIGTEQAEQAFEVEPMHGLIGSVEGTLSAVARRPVADGSGMGSGGRVSGMLVGGPGGESRAGGEMIDDFGGESLEGGQEGFDASGESIVGDECQDRQADRGDQRQQSVGDSRSPGSGGGKILQAVLDHAEGAEESDQGGEGGDAAQGRQVAAESGGLGRESQGDPAFDIGSGAPRATEGGQSEAGRRAGVDFAMVGGLVPVESAVEQPGVKAVGVVAGDDSGWVGPREAFEEGQGG
jgi:hypothetical protein